MKFLFDLFPVILFFGMFKWGERHPDAALAMAERYLSGLSADGGFSATQAPILLATAIAILATLAQIGYLLLRRRKVDGMLWVSLAIIVIFGGATIYFHNETFIKWKPTVLYWLFGIVLLGSQKLFGKNLIETMLGKQMTLETPVWTRLNLVWALFFLLMGVVNLVVAYNFSTAAWVNFKLFGFTGLMLVFVLAQSFMLSKHIKDQG